MSSNRESKPGHFVKPVVVFLTKDAHCIPHVEERLTTELGIPDHRTSVICSAEGVHRVFLSFERLIEAEHIPGICRCAEAIRVEFNAAVNGGYVENSKVVFGGAITHFKDNPGFDSDVEQKFFVEVRQTYRNQLRTMCLLKNRSNGRPSV